MKKTIGILVCGHMREGLVERHGEYDRLYRALLGEDGFSYEAYRVVDGEFPASIDVCDGYVLSGSAHGAYEDHAFIPPLENLIREAYRMEIPQVGICFGHQIVAQALGGKVEKFSGGWGLGVQNYDIDFGNGPEAFSLHAVHQDQVVSLPPEARVIGQSEFCRNAAISYGNAALTLQAHPEFDAGFMRDLIELRRDLSFPVEIADRAIGQLGRETANAAVAGHIRKFLS
ncbi:MAG: type 1 glutamine amidotransferase [Pseudomonadota bacterium]